MSQERWDVALRFLNGPLQYQGEIVIRGPVVPMGANPGPVGLKLEGYRGLDARQAVITAYDGGTVSIVPIGSNQIRMAPHANVEDWGAVHPLREKTYLSPGCAVHLGPVGRGATFEFVECRRLGVWEQRAILSEAADAEPEIQGSEVKEVADRRFPWWVIPGYLTVFVAFLGSLSILIFMIVRRDVDTLGPTWEGQEEYEVDEFLKVTEINTDVYSGVEQAYAELIAKPNAAAANWPQASKQENWDKDLIGYVTRAEQQYVAGWRFWVQLDSVREDYAYVLAELRNAGLPDVLAAIPFQESRYSDAKDVLYCARGFWQFQPEVAIQAGMTVRDCKLRGSSVPWTPVEKVPPRKLAQNAIYVSNDRCLIDTCAQDDRGNLRASTKGAIQLLSEAFNDDELKFSGAVTQITIASHNAGYDNSRYYKDGRANIYNMLPAYRAYVKDQKRERAPDFVGENITCTQPGQAKNHNDRCGGYLAQVTQHYVPNIIAQHFLATCYYAKNYGNDKAFAVYRDFVRGNGYCGAINVPTIDKVREHASGGGKKK